MGLNPLQPAVALLALLGSLVGNLLCTELTWSGDLDLSAEREGDSVVTGPARFWSEDSNLEEAVQHLEGVVRDSIHRELRSRPGPTSACDCCIRLGLSGYLTGFASASVSTGALALVVACLCKRSPSANADHCEVVPGTPVVTRSRRAGALADLAVNASDLR